MRLDKFLAHSGLGTRTQVKNLVRRGLIRVDGELVRDAGMHLEAGARVTLDGEPVSLPRPVAVAFHKPRGLITSTKDDQETIYSLLPFDPKKVKYAGRLDKESEGLLILLEDGQLNHRIISPRWKLEKEYVVDLDAPLEKEGLERLKQPMTLENEVRVAGAVRAELLEDGRILLVITEGKYHQVRRMFAVLGRTVTRLVRTRVGPVVLGDLPVGRYRDLEEGELERLRKACGFL